MNFSFGKLPHDLVGAWLKPTGASDTVHQVIWRGGDELRAGCQLAMDARCASSPRLGARICETCRCNQQDREKHGKSRTR